MKKPDPRSAKALAEKLTDLNRRMAGYVVDALGRPVAVGVVCRCDDDSVRTCPAHGRKRPT